MEAYIIEKNNLVPNINIESFGIYKKPRWEDDRFGGFKKFFIASFTFHIKKLFKTYTKVIYLPLLFNDKNVNELHNIFKYYENLYFFITFKRGYSTPQENTLYHISNIVNFDKIIQKYIKEINSDTRIFDISFIIKDYEGYNILISDVYRYNPYTSYKDKELAALNDLYSTNDDKNCIELIKYDYEYIPEFTGFTTNTEDGENTYKRSTIEQVMKHIDEVNERDEEFNRQIDSMYSKTTFKLVVE